MEIQLSSGEIDGNEALEILTGHIHLEIRFYTRKMESALDQGTVSACKDAIRNLQKYLFDAANFMKRQHKVQLNCHITLS